MTELIAKLAKIGLSPYEAKALLALMTTRQANGYEVAKQAGIPTSKVYASLTRLVNKGIVVVDRSTKPSRYSPVPVAELIDRLRLEYRAALDDLEGELSRMRPLPDLDLSWNLLGEEAVIEKMRDLIRAAVHVVYLSLWPRLRSRLASEIAACRRRGVRIVLACFGPVRSRDPFSISMAGCGTTSESRLKARLSIAVADSSQVVICDVRDERDSRGVWTATPSIVVVAKEYVRHDIWGRILINELGETRFEQLCGENELLSYLIRNP